MARRKTSAPQVSTASNSRSRRSFAAEGKLDAIVMGWTVQPSSRRSDERDDDGQSQEGQRCLQDFTRRRVTLRSRMSPRPFVLADV